MTEQFENVCFEDIFTCSEKVRARSVSTPPAGGSTISWERRIRLEPCSHKQSLYLYCSFCYHFKETIIHLIWDFVYSKAFRTLDFENVAIRILSSFCIDKN